MFITGAGGCLLGTIAKSDLGECVFICGNCVVKNIPNVYIAHFVECCKLWKMNEWRSVSLNVNMCKVEQLCLLMAQKN